MTTSLAELKEKLEKEDTSIRSKANNPTSLNTFLYIYIRTEAESYPDYLRGARALAAWLAPIDIPDIPAELKVANIHMGYTTNELAKILIKRRAGEHFDSYHLRLYKTSRAIACELAALLINEGVKI